MRAFLFIGMVLATMSVFSQRAMNPDKCYKCESGVFYKIFHIRFCNWCEERENETPVFSESTQPVNSDTLFFSNEVNLRDWLVNSNISNYYTITPPKKSFDCSTMPSSTIYPAQQEDDYLNESRFNGLQGVSLIDHIRTRKVINVFTPGAISLAEQINSIWTSGGNSIVIKDQYGSVAYSGSLSGAIELLYPGKEQTLPLPLEYDFCDVWEYYTNPVTGQVVCFKGIYTWYDERGEQMFNVNKKLYQIWGFNSGVYSFVINTIHKPTGLDYAYKLVYQGHETAEIRFNFIESVFPYRK